MNKPLLVLQSSERLTPQQQEEVFNAVRPVAAILGAQLIISDASTTVTVHQDLGPVVAAIEAQTEAINRLRLLAEAWTGF